MYLRMRYSRLFPTILLLGALSGAPFLGADDFAPWYADFSRYGDQAANTGLTAFDTLKIPMGGEYEGMGTAYTAIARGTGFFEANPAASSRLPFTEFALFHNNLIADTAMEAAVFTVRTEELGVGLAVKYLHVPFTAYDDFGRQQSSIRFTESLIGINASYNVLRGFYFNGISLGANLKFAMRPLPDQLRPDMSNQSLYSPMIDLGAYTSFDFLKFYSSLQRNLSLGVALKNVGLPARGDPLPTMLSAGVGYAPARPILLSADINVPLILFSNLPPEPIGFAVGSAVQFTDFVVVHGGLLWRGGNPRITTGGSVTISDRMTLTFNYTLDLTTQFSSPDRFSISSRFSLGDRGRAVRAQSLRSYYLDALVAFAVGDLERTVDLCNRALELDPSFEPARETLATASRMLELQRRMESIRTVE